VLDTQAGMLLHESGLLPALYVPVADVRSELLVKTEHSTHCPYKGDASYWSMTVGDRTAENAVWGYEAPLESANFIEGYLALYWDRVDQWFDEDEEVFGHLCAPYHRIDIRPTSRPIRVNYIPEADVLTDLFEDSETVTHCPYKGSTNYRRLLVSDEAADVAWIYPEPFDESLRIAGCWSFDGDGVEVTDQ